MDKQHKTLEPLIQHVSYTTIAAIIASISAAICAAIQLPVWAMFIGWVAFFTRGLNLRHTVINLTCVWIGIAIGMIAGLAMEMLRPMLDAITLPFVVFIVAMLVISLRSMPKTNNLLGYFLGLISFFASHYIPSIDNFVVLAGATAIGALSGLVSLFLQHSILSRTRTLES